MIRSFSTGVVSNPSFRRRGPDAKLLYFMLYMHPGNHLCGVFAVGLDHLALDCGFSEERTKDALAELIQHGWADVDLERELIWLPEMTRRVGDVKDPHNPVGKSVRKYLESLEPCPLLKKVSEALSLPYSHPMPGSIPKGLDRTLTVSGSDSGSGTGSDEKPFAVGLAPPPRPKGAHAPASTGQRTDGGEPLAEGAAHQNATALPPDHGARRDNPGRGAAQGSRHPGPSDGSSAQGGLPGLVPAGAPERSKRRTRRPADEPEPVTTATWEAYAAVFLRRYGTKPIRNRKVNGQLAQFVGRVPREDAPQIAAHYVTNPDGFYVKQMHPIGLLLRDAEKLAASWQRDEHVNPTAARREEQTHANPALSILNKLDRGEPDDDGDK